MSLSTSFPKGKLNILLLENISAVSIETFKNMGYVSITSVKGAYSEDELIAALKDVHILGIRSKTKLSEKVFAHAPKLLAVGCFCIGVNQVDLAAASKKGVAVFNAPFSNTRSVAELAIAEIIMLIRKIPLMNQLAHKGIWQKESKNCFEVRGKVLGIVGYGHIGSQVSVLAEDMGMKVVYFDVETKLPLGNAVPITQLDDLLSVADIVSLHVPESNDTHQMIDEQAFLKMKQGAILINLSRGSVVDLQALHTSITNGKIAGAAIDVFPTEPEKTGDSFQHFLQNVPNVILTPHIGGSTEEAQFNIGIDVSNKLIQFIERGNSMGSHSIPGINVPMQKTTRILHIHDNVPGVLSEINARLAARNINIVAQYLNTNELIGYVILDVEKGSSGEVLEQVQEVKNTIRTRILY
jgi:D-3-phosphoglycerate dehydrogenase